MERILWGALMQRSLGCATVLAGVALLFVLTSGKTTTQAQARQSGHQPSEEAAGEGPAVQMLVTQPISRRDLRKLVTSSRTLHDHPNLAEYYRQEARRLQAESKKYERFARAAGDTTPLSEPNHYAVSRTARFDYIVAKDQLKKAQDASRLADLNAQAAEKEGCFSCHSFHGRGGVIGPDLAIEGTRKRSDAWLIGHFKDPQALSPSSAMPAFGGLTNRQLEVLSAFLQFQK